MVPKTWAEADSKNDAKISTKFTKSSNINSKIGRSTQNSILLFSKYKLMKVQETLAHLKNLNKLIQIIFKSSWIAENVAVAFLLCNSFFSHLLINFLTTHTIEHHLSKYWIKFNCFHLSFASLKLIVQIEGLF